VNGSRPRRFVRRLLGAAGTILFVVLLNFFLFRILPGDPARGGSADPRLTAEAQAAIRGRFGLDLPLVNGVVSLRPLRLGAWSVDPRETQLGRYLGAISRGDLGTSYATNRPVATVLRERLGPTLLLLVTAQGLALVAGATLGGLAAWRRGKPFDVAARGAALVAWSLPSFWLGLLILFCGGRWLGLPIGGVRTPGLEDLTLASRLADLGRHLVLPALTLAIVFIGEYLLVARATLLETLGEDYVLAGKARGLGAMAILRRHALPNAALPLATLAALNLGFTVAGAVQVEMVFSWPGIGAAVYEAVVQRDFPLLQGAFLVLALAVVLANAAIDLASAAIDPRVEGAS
jgi:peptide/nickel transport system permease protein